MSEGTEVLPAAICSPADQLRFERLWDRTIGTGFKVVIWEVPEPSARSQVLEWLEPRVNQQSARLIPVDLVELLGREVSTLPQTFNIWRELTARVPPASVSDHNAILVLTGFEELMYQPNVDRSVLLQQFNIQRDSLVRDFPCWWILLIHPASRQVWKTVAPDFCDFVALWIEADAALSRRDANSQLSVESEKSQSDAFESGGSMRGLYEQLKSAQAAILLGQFDSALDQITSFEVQIDPKRGEREMALASLLKGDIFLNRGDSERALQLWRDKVLPVFRRLESLNEESQTLHRIASVVETQGNLPEAKRLFGESLRISQRLAESDPANDALQRDLSMSFDRLGALATTQGNLPEAQRFFGKSLRIRQRLAESDPANAAWQRDLSVSFGKLGNLARAQGNLPEAQRLFGESLRIAQRLAESDPANAEWQHDLWVLFGKLGGLAEAQGNLSEAQRLFSESLRIGQRLAESDPANAAWQRDLSVSFNNLGDLAKAQRNLPEAQRLFGESLRIRQRLAESDPANAVWQRDLSVSFDRLGDLAEAQGNLPEAQRVFGESYRIAQRLAESDPANAVWQRDLSVSFGNLGVLAATQGNLPEAQRLFGESLRIRQRLAEAEPANAAWQRDLSVSYWRIANVTEQQNLPEAGDYWQKALVTLERMMAAGLFVSEKDLSVLSALRAKVQS